MTSLNQKNNLQKKCLEAEKKIREFIRFTPNDYSFYLSKITSARVFLKLENIQITGSFKLRGALNKILSLVDSQKKRGLVTASSGNHGAAVSYASKILGIKSTIFLPSYVSKTKIEALKLYGPEIKIFGEDCLEAELQAKKEAKKRQATYISPYNDLKVVAGQGTIGVELWEQLPEMDVVIVPVGGGGLISGVAGYLKSKNPGIEIIGAQPENSPVMYESIKTGEIVEMKSKPTLSDGTAGGIEQGSITFDLCQKTVDRFIIPTEDEIAEALRLVIEKEHFLIEGAAALSVSALMKEKEKFSHKNVVLVVSGAKLSLEKLKQIMG